MSSNNGDRMLPRNIEAEKAVLSCMLKDEKALAEIGIILSAECFSTDSHRKIFRAIIKLYVRHTAVDLVALADILASQGFIEDCGGYTGLAEIWDATATSGSYEYYANIVKEKALTRDLILLGNDIAAEAFGGAGPIDDMLSSAESRIFSLANSKTVGQTVPFRKAVDETLDLIDKRALGPEKGGVLFTGYFDLDERIAGLHRGEMTVLAARPSVGKTALALNIVNNICVHAGHAVFFASLEQSRHELIERLLSMHSGVAFQAIRKARLKPDDVDRLTGATARINNSKLFINDSADQNMLSIAANARRLVKEESIKLVVIDYLGLIEPENRRDNRTEQISQITRQTKKLARNIAVPVILLSQLNRSAAGETPRLHHLRDSGSIEQDADSVWLLHKPDDNTNTLDLNVAKQRNGPTGVVSLTFNKQVQLIETFAPQI